MELYWQPSSSPGILLTGEISEEGMQSGELESRTIIDAPSLIDAQEIEAIDYGNEQTSLSFVVERTWATPGEAAAYWLSHPGEIPTPRTGRLRMRAQQTDTSVVLERWLNGAAITSLRGTFDGCSTRFTYTLIGGAISAP